MKEIAENSEAISLALSIFTLIIVQAIKQFSKKDITRALPLISIGIGVSLGLLVAFSTGADVLTYVFAGILTGGAASGFYDSGKSIKGDEE